MCNQKYKYLAKNTIVFTISSFGSKILAFLLVPFYTNILSTSEYGTADLITTSASLLFFAVTICISDAVLRFGFEQEDGHEGVFKYGLNVIFRGFSLFGVGLLAFSFYNPLHWEKYLYLLLFLTVCSNSLNQIVANYLRAIDRTYAFAIMGILTTLFAIVSNIVFLIIIRLSVIGYLLSFVIGYTLAAIYGFIIICKYDKDWLRQECSTETKKKMVKYSLPLIPNGLAWWMNSSLDRYFIIFYCDVPANGLFAVASKIPTILNVINHVFHQAWNLSAIREYNTDDKDGFFHKVYSTYNMVLVISCSILVLLNIQLAKLLFAKDFFHAWEYSSILLLSAVFSALSGFIGSVFVAVKESKIFAKSTVIAAIANTILNWAMIPLFGVIGAAVATIISFAIIWGIRYYCATKYITLSTCLPRDILSYGLIGIQVLLEHLRPERMAFQIVCISVLLLMYIKELKQFIVFFVNHANKTFKIKE